MYPLILGVVTTYRCPLQCEHCCFECGPHRKEEIDTDKVQQVIDRLASNTSIKCVAFTGGEPLLLKEKLYRLIRYAAEKGLSTRVVTSGFWANSPHRKEKIISELAEAGLNELNISTGDYHASFVPVDNVCQAALAAAQAGMQTMIAVEHHPQSDLNKEYIVDHIEDLAGENTFQNPIRVMENILVPMEIQFEKEIKKTTANDPVPDQGCKNIALNLSLLPTGEVYSCCGLTMHKIPELILGSMDTLIASQTKKDLENFLFSNLIHLWLAVDGPSALGKIVESETGSQIITNDMKHRCHQCLALFSHKDTRTILKAHASQEKNRIMLAFFQQQYFFSEMMK